ncbi:MAG: polysulfide reductase NrfD [Alphaproteobacteria bacterium]|nr:polysulfide reductase NrfD [Alphaproteobacteria bacterium]
MKRTVYRELDLSPGFLLVLGLLGLIAAAGLGAAWYMEHYGHIVTGMNNQVVWGLPHVFAIFLIVAASGALNVASLASVFNRTMYKPMARLSGLLAISLLAGGLAVLVLDLGRPDRLIVAMTHFNFKSIFAWNIFLYTGFFVIVAAYLFTQMGRGFGRFIRPAGWVAFVWRLALTTGTGSIFGWLVAREAYDAAIMAPLFIAMSLSFGLAVFILFTGRSCALSGREFGQDLLLRLGRLLGLFIAAVLYFTAVQHLTALYAAEHHDIESFILFGDSIYTTLFWTGQVLIGGVVPLILVTLPTHGVSRVAIKLACALVIVGGFVQVYVIVIGGQVYPLALFPGMEVRSSFQDGVIAGYQPSLPEFLLGIGGVALALAIAAIGMKSLRFLPESLADEAVDPQRVPRTGAVT